MSLKKTLFSIVLLSQVSVAFAMWNGRGSQIALEAEQVRRLGNIEWNRAGMKGFVLDDEIL